MADYTDLEHLAEKVERLERQIDALTRGLALITASVGPGLEWTMAKLKEAENDGE